MKLRPAIPATVLQKLRKICLSLDGVTEEDAWIGTRFTVKKRNFAHVLTVFEGHPPTYAKAARADGPLVMVTFRAVEPPRAPYFPCAWGTTWGTKVVGVVIDAKTDWKALRALIVESHRLMMKTPGKKVFAG